MFDCNLVLKKKTSEFQVTLHQINLRNSTSVQKVGKYSMQTKGRRQRDMSGKLQRS